MNQQPVSYLQTDSRWKSLPYRVPGENATIGDSGCGPTAAAMAITTLTGKTFTPVDACAWSVAHGYKALHQGTYYGYFAAQFSACGIDCKQLLGSRLSNQPNHAIHNQVRQYLADGYYVIALMGPGLWTSGGHFVLLWAWDDKVRINDPASTRTARLNGDPELFKKQVRNYWLIDARDYNNPKQEDEDMDQSKFNEMFRVAMDQYRQELAAQPAGMPEKAEEAKAMGIANGMCPRALLTREEGWTMGLAAVREAVRQVLEAADTARADALK